MIAAGLCVMLVDAPPVASAVQNPDLRRAADRVRDGADRDRADLFAVPARQRQSALAGARAAVSRHQPHRDRRLRGRAQPCILPRPAQAAHRRPERELGPGAGETVARAGRACTALQLCAPQTAPASNCCIIWPPATGTRRPPTRTRTIYGPRDRIARLPAPPRVGTAQYCATPTGMPFASSLPWRLRHEPRWFPAKMQTQPSHTSAADALERLTPIRFGRAICGDPTAAERREWWIANGLSGYSAGHRAG